MAEKGVDSRLRSVLPPRTKTKHIIINTNNDLSKIDFNTFPDHFISSIIGYSQGIIGLMGSPAAGTRKNELPRGGIPIGPDRKNGRHMWERWGLKQLNRTEVVYSTGGAVYDPIIAYGFLDPTRNKRRLPNPFHERMSKMYIWYLGEITKIAAEYSAKLMVR